MSDSPWVQQGPEQRCYQYVALDSTQLPSTGVVQARLTYGDERQSPPIGTLLPVPLPAIRSHNDSCSCHAT